MRTLNKKSGPCCPLSKKHQCVCRILSIALLVEFWIFCAYSSSPLPFLPISWCIGHWPLVYRMKYSFSTQLYIFKIISKDVNVKNFVTRCMSFPCSALQYDRMHFFCQLLKINFSTSRGTSFRPSHQVSCFFFQAWDWFTLVTALHRPRHTLNNSFAPSSRVILNVILALVSPLMTWQSRSSTRLDGGSAQVRSCVFRSEELVRSLRRDEP